MFKTKKDVLNVHLFILIYYFLFISLVASIIDVDIKAKTKQVIKFSKVNDTGISNIPLINGNNVASNITKQVPTAINTYLFVVNPNLTSVSVLDLDGNVCSILDKVSVKNAIAHPNSGELFIPIY